MNASRIWSGRLPILLILMVGLGWCPDLAGAANADPFPPATPESQGLSSEAVEELADTVRGYFENEQIVGAELLVVKNRRTVLHEAIGWKDLPDEIPMKTNTIFNIRSMTKPIIGTAVQMLIDDEKLTLDDRVSKFLPSFDNDKSGEITIEHLLTHRSGFPQGSPPPPLTQYGSLRGVAGYWGRRGPDQFEPGEGYCYSDPGVDTLGAIVIEVSGQPLDRFVERRLFNPTGMTDSFGMTVDFNLGEDFDDYRQGRMSSNHAGSQGSWTRYWKPGDGPLAPFVKGSGTTWYSSPVDYARFLALWMDNGRVGEQRLLSEAAIARGLTPVSKLTHSTGFTGLTVHYGQLWSLRMSAKSDDDTQPVVFGHSGSDGTWAWAFPEHDLMVLYFTQSRGTRTGIELEKHIDRLLIMATRTDTSQEVEPGR
jgi:CubicO group peptidase (beta-lactamase class C family)